jgi:predicted nucleotidyltransferase
MAVDMVSAESILHVAEHISRLFRPRKILLFGSYACGAPGPDSDVDLMVVMPHRQASHQKATEIRLSLMAQFPMDLLVRSPAELRAGLRQNDWFIVEVLEKGIVLYDGTDRAVGAKGRSRLRRRLAPAAKPAMYLTTQFPTRPRACG